MTDSDDLEKLRERALASETDANQLFDIAAQHPEVFAEVAANSNAYPDLLNWLEQVGDDRVKAVVAARRGGLMGRAALAQADSATSGSSSPQDFLAPQMPRLSSDSQKEPEEATPANESASPYSPFAPREEEDFPVTVADAATAEAASLDEDAQVTENISSKENESAEEAENGSEPADLETEELAETSVESQLESKIPDEQGSEAGGDVDATRLGSIPVENLAAAFPPMDEGETRLAATVSLPTQPEAPTYPLPQQQPVIPPPANYPAYSPYPAYYANPAAVSAPQPQKPKRNWGIIILTVLLVLALISFTVVVTWIVSSRGGKAGASGSDTARTSAKVTTASQNVTTTAQTSAQVSTQSGKPIPADAIYEDHGFFTPTRNIGCMTNGGEISCEIYQRQWEQGCSGSWVMEVKSSGVTEWCNTHDANGDPQTPASYGSVYYNGDFACEVGENTGVNCWNSKTGRGFTMRIQDHSTY